MLQGLFYDGNDTLYESTGLYGKVMLRILVLLRIFSTKIWCFPTTISPGLPTGVGIHLVIS